MVLLDALGASDGSRPDILRALFGRKVRGGLLGDFAIDAHGDTSQTTMAIYRIRSGKLRFEAEITPPAALLSRR
jgi:hypothetical protein